MQGSAAQEVAGEPAVRILGLTKRFGALAAVDRLDLEVARGELFGLVGPDGAGKTTVMRLLAGIMIADGCGASGAEAHRRTRGYGTDLLRADLRCIGLRA